VRAADSVEIDLGRVAVLPGLVNAHTHLELSWMRDRVGAAASLPEWVRRLMALRQSERDLAPGALKEAVRIAIAEARRAGTALVGDIGNTTAALDLIAEGGLAGVFFREVIGFAPPDPATLVGQACDEMGAAAPPESPVRRTLAAHAPYSVSPLVLRAIRETLDRRGFPCSSVHLAESSEELEFLQRGSGAWRSILESVGAWTDTWHAPACGPVEYLERAGFLDERLLVVHGVHLTPEEMTRLAQVGATVVTCPRGNLSTGAGVPPVVAFHRSGVRVAVGTDSLASVDDLNVFSELAALRRLTTDISAGELLRWATLNGAEALGFAGDFGAIEAGRRGALLAVSLPVGVRDVEEYLVGGIDPDDVAWVEALVG
jgi:cytosine/adenosine deaminase-related metal-dependent hydrolase